MSNNISKSREDSKHLLIKKEEERAEKKRKRETMNHALEHGEKVQDILPSWDNHIKAGHTIRNFTSIVNNQMYLMEPGKDHSFIPFSEYCGSYSLNWIIKWDNINKKEVFRKNVLYVDLIEWETNEPKN